MQGRANWALALADDVNIIVIQANPEPSRARR